METDKKVTKQVRISEDWHRRVKLYALENDQSMSDTLGNILRTCFEMIRRERANKIKNEQTKYISVQKHRQRIGVCC
ncbi:hypothetical protein COB18_01930 [Candidatus Kaiserbacteria bacterium]|nr:MAG: hypothetical protein COB18_01930 [Candidatus Kaiserbacteria bacterium]